MLTLALLAIGPIITLRYDIVPAVVVLAALYAVRANRPGISSVLLAIATLVKAYSAVLVPVLLLYFHSRQEYVRIRTTLCTYIVFMLVVGLPVVMFAGAGLADVALYHSERGLQIESTYASLLIVAHNHGLVSIGSEFSYGSWNLTGVVADRLAGCSVVLMATAVVTSYWLMVRLSKTSPMSFVDCVAWSIALLAAIIATSKVFSPEYLIWLYPLIPLLSSRARFPPWILFVVIGTLTYYVYPLHYWELVWLSFGVSVVLLIRNLLVVVLAVLIVRQNVGRRRRDKDAGHTEGDVFGR